MCLYFKVHFKMEGFKQTKEIFLTDLLVSKMMYIKF